MEHKKKIILAHEQQLAQALAREIIAKPPLSVWYILIPVIFVFYFMRLSQYSDSVRDFIEQYMKPRRTALDEALAAIEAQRRADAEVSLDTTRVPRAAHEAYRSWQQLLMAHYGDLLRAHGKRYDALVRSAYGTRGNYLLFLNRLNKAEQRLDTDLRNHIDGERQAVAKTIDRMEACIEDLRRREAEGIFP